MKRRNFLKISLFSPIIFREFIEARPIGQIRFVYGDASRYGLLELKGNYRKIGYQIGRYFRKNIETIIQRRKSWHNNLLSILDTPEGKARSEVLKDAARRHFPHLLEEIEGMADGAGMHFKAIWAMTVKSELGALENETPGCSTIFSNSGEKKWLFHNEDGDVTYLDIMFMVKVYPPSGVNFISLVYPGILTGNGPSLNSRGIVQTTNYIGGLRSEPGIPRYVLGRAILEAADLEEAEQIATLTPRAYPYHHNLASFEEGRYLSVETVPGLAQSISPAGIYVHTNHLLHDQTAKYAHEDSVYKNSSSMSRYSVIEQNLKKIKPEEDLSPENLLSILSSHEQAPYSPCRHPRGKITGQTLATAFFDLGKGLFRLYRGNPCKAVPRELYKDYSF
ncbi:MAG: C45 family autoproteolytic acyltransferase/hydrolase [Calditrichia bacterium]